MRPISESEERTIGRPDLDGTLLVAGLGVHGRAVADALLRRGHPLVLADDAPSTAVVAWAADRGCNLEVAPGARRWIELVDAADVFLPTPGMADRHPAVVAAIDTGTAIRSELDLAGSWDDRPVIAVTGTNGKTTVTWLIAESLRAGGRKAEAVGNFGEPLVAAIDDPAPEIFVVEASSFLLAHTAYFRPAVATWLNFAPDHLDVHASLEAYRAAKARIWSDQEPRDTAVVNAADPVVVAADSGVARRVLFGSPTTDWRVEGDDLVGPTGPFIAASELLRRHPHDLVNALAVAASVAGVSVGIDAVAEVLARFEGLKHRIQLVASAAGVDWYDDSKSTTPHATRAALGCFERVVLIAGGRNKGLDLAPMFEVDRLAAVVAIGESADEVLEAVAERVPTARAESMTEAVGVADHLARSGDVVLLSPGCASFDWYRSYADRGDDFTNRVRDLLEDDR